MINGYLTINELQLITGYSRNFINQLIQKGLPYHEFEILDEDNLKPRYNKFFNLKETESWICLHMF